MCAKFYRTVIGTNVIDCVRNCFTIISSRGTLSKYQTQFRLFPADGHVEYIAMNPVDPLKNTTTGKDHIIFITDSYSKLYQTTALSRTTATYIVAIFLNTWMFMYVIPHSILTYNRP